MSIREAIDRIPRGLPPPENTPWPLLRPIYPSITMASLLKFRRPFSELEISGPLYCGASKILLFSHPIDVHIHGPASWGLRF